MALSTKRNLTDSQALKQTVQASVKYVEEGWLSA
jgi:hypothetical protein